MASVLIADDDQMVVDLVTFRLERMGHRVTSATDGELALQKIEASPPDVLILDYQIPVVSAASVVSTLAENPDWRDLPVLVLASEWREQDVIEALDSGIADYMTKPFSPDELVRRVHRLLPRKR